MPTNDERREVARKLRELGPSADKHSLDYDDVCQRTDEIIGTVECGSWKVFFDRLADLIEPQERTCRMERIEQPVGFTLKCDVCGNELGVYETEVERYAYCPNCGAKVVAG